MTTVQALKADQASSTAKLRPRAVGLVSRFRSCATLYLLMLRQHLHGKRWIALAILFVLPAGMAVLIRMSRSHTPSTFLEFWLSWILIPQALLPLAALLYASGIIQDEQEEQTITYLFIRPMQKWMIYAVKMLATWTTIVVLIIVLTVLAYTAIYANSGANFSEVGTRCLKASAILSLAGIAYCSLFGLIGLLTKRILIVGILYTAIIEGLLASFPLSLRLGTIVYYTRLLAYRTLNFKVTWPQQGRAETDIAATVWSLDTVADPKLAEHPQINGCILTLLIASVVCLVLASWLCSRREFHVKTPETE